MFSSQLYNPLKTHSVSLPVTLQRILQSKNTRPLTDQFVKYVLKCLKNSCNFGSGSKILFGEVDILGEASE